jgi:putative SOS response-associated peptidase YedK
VHRLPAFRDAFVRRRCLVPVDGFYEWTGEPGARRPVVFHRSDDGVLLLFGLYQDDVDEKTGEHRTTFAVLTTSPNSRVASIHDRMPVLTTPDSPSVAAWLAESPPGQFAAGPLLSLLRPAPDDLLVGEEIARRPPRPPLEPPIRLARRAPGSAPDDGERAGSPGDEDRQRRDAERTRPADRQLKLF